MRATFFVVIVMFVVASTFAQTDIENMIGTERAFAKLASEKGTKAAFLANAAADGVVFVPDKVNAKDFWIKRPESESLLSWAPNFADVSSNGVIGYSTGNWEYRLNGKDDTPTGFGQFITIWLRQSNGSFKFVVDIGVEHPKPAAFSTELKEDAKRSSDLNEKNSSAADNAAGFFNLLRDSRPSKAYSLYADENIRSYREGKAPFIGKKAVIALFKEEKGRISLPKQSSFFGSADIAYSLNTYSRSVGGNVVERGNTLQIWKLINGVWLIVLDIYKVVP